MKLSFLCAEGYDTFIRDTVRRLDSEGYETRLTVTHIAERIDEAIEWGDVIWFEFANEVAVYGTNSKAIENKKVVVNFASYEAFRPQTRQIKWENINLLLFVDLLEFLHVEL